MNRPVNHGPDAMSLQDTAKECGVSWERFRKVWKAWRRELGFPAPFKTPDVNGRGTYAWRASAVQAWKLAREAALGACDPDAGGPEPAAGLPRRPLNDNPRPPRNARLERDRQALARMMESQ